MLVRLTTFLAIASVLTFGTGRAEAPFEIGTVVALSYSSNGRLVAVADMARKLAIYRANDGSLVPGQEPDDPWQPIYRMAWKTSQ